MRADPIANLARTTLLAAELGSLLRVSFCASAATPNAAEVLLLLKPLPLLRLPFVEALLGPKAEHVGDLRA